MFHLRATLGVEVKFLARDGQWRSRALAAPFDSRQARRMLDVTRLQGWTIEVVPAAKLCARCGGKGTVPDELRDRRATGLAWRCCERCDATGVQVDQ